MQVLRDDGAPDQLPIGSIPDDLLPRCVSPGSRVRVAELSWGNKEQLEELLSERSFGMIVGADVAYDEDAHAPLLSTISECLAKNPAAKARVPAAETAAS